ncbi:MAG: dienelactone hydrolase family protein [Xanthomonadales bacterium]|nr:dienelactone hydrolase family protein [Gammaproteobacteria bacterium]NND57118.1 dienelactone hydrolase family protein [Xanthomonadales bacterium]NNK52768.1 dienelactone hydrolase family protein [Xanthomonadales bacterium]
MANIQSEQITYSFDGVDMQAYIAWDSDLEGERPGVLVVHEWWGKNAYAQRRADMLANLGYTAMALDMYGGGKTAENPDQAGELMNGLLADLGTVRERFNAALKALRAHGTADAAKTAAIGYCMGGGIVLHMARYGADLKAVASFHGALPLGVAAEGEGGKVTARVAVYHGEDDVLIPDEAVTSFRAEMEKTGADCLFVPLPTALHGFSNPAATTNGEKYGLPLRYDERADYASWNHMQLVLQSAFQ